MNANTAEIYIGTVCLERTRWGRREPSLKVSEWLPRFAADGFDGIELWEFHYTKADDAERERLADAGPLAMYNTYAGFGDDDADARTQAAEAIARLGAGAVKYNLGGDAEKLDEYRRNLMAWAEELPASCRLLCECHPGTVLENLDDAVAFFADLDPVRFGVIAHLSGGETAGVDDFFARFDGRVKHLHLQMRDSETDPTEPANRERLASRFEALPRNGFDGSLAIEFTRGIGRDEEIEALYANARADMAFAREALAAAECDRM